MRAFWPCRPGAAAIAAVLMPGIAACVSTTQYEHSALERIGEDPAERALRLHAPDTPASPAAEPRIDGTLDGYVAYALRENPSLRASFEDWRAAVYAIAEGRRLPDPMITYGVFLRRVETRVGPQRQRVGVRQKIPWPTKRRAAAAAAAHMARAAEERLDVQTLSILRRVADAYWRVWTIQRLRNIELEQQEVLAEMATTVRSRIEIGKASLADAAQVDLALSRRADALAALDEQERSARAALRLAIGAPADMDLPVAAEAPDAVVPAATDDELRQAARSHPRVTALAAMADAKDSAARAARAQGMPDVTLGADYIDTGAAAMDVPDSGKDPIMLSLGVTVPIWRSTYRAAAGKAEAEAASLRARQAQAENQAEAELITALADVSDAARRIALYRDTLIPQARTMYAAVIGSYQTGASSLANTLMAQQSVLDLRTQLVRARADHARAWARLVEVAGRPVAARPVAAPGADASEDATGTPPSKTTDASTGEDTP